MQKYNGKNNEEILNKLVKLQDKLYLLQEFSKQSKQFRMTRRNLLNQIENLNSEIKTNESRLDKKQVTFAEIDKNNLDDNRPHTLSRIPSYNSVKKTKKSSSLCDLLTNLHTWHEEISHRKSEIELLKMRRHSSVLTETNTYDNMIMKLEKEKDQLDEKILHFVLKNINENKEDYQNLISHLEDENKEMEDRIMTMERQVKFLKDTNIALMRENLQLKKDYNLAHISSFIIEEEELYEIMGKESVIVPETLLYETVSEEMRTKSMQMFHNLEEEDRLSLDQISKDSFTLDIEIATWKMDEDSLHDKVKRLALDLHEMEVTHMKLNLVKRHVRKHGTKHINRNTLIDPAHGMSFWHF